MKAHHPANLRPRLAPELPARPIVRMSPTLRAAALTEEERTVLFVNGILAMREPPRHGNAGPRVVR